MVLVLWSSFISMWKKLSNDAMTPQAWLLPSFCSSHGQVLAKYRVVYLGVLEPLAATKCLSRFGSAVAQQSRVCAKARKLRLNRLRPLEIAQNGNFHGEHFDMINQWWSRCCRVGSEEPERSESNGLKVTKVSLQSTGEETERFQKNSAVSLRVHLSCRFSINMLRNRLPALWNWCLLSRKERYTAQKLMDDDGCEWWWMWWWWMIVDDGRWWWMIVVVWCCFFGQSRDVAPARTQVCALRFQLLCSSTSLSTGPAGFQAHWKEPLLGLHGLRCLVGSCCCEFWSTLFSQSWNWRIDIFDLFEANLYLFVWFWASNPSTIPSRVGTSTKLFWFSIFWSGSLGLCGSSRTAIWPSGAARSICQAGGSSGTFTLHGFPLTTQVRRGCCCNGLHSQLPWIASGWSSVWHVDVSAGASFATTHETWHCPSWTRRSSSWGRSPIKWKHCLSKT